jgi:hypothetical protein
MTEPTNRDRALENVRRAKAQKAEKLRNHPGIERSRSGAGDPPHVHATYGRVSSLGPVAVHPGRTA